MPPIQDYIVVEKKDPLPPSPLDEPVAGRGGTRVGLLYQHQGKRPLTPLDPPAHRARLFGTAAIVQNQYLEALTRQILHGQRFEQFPHRHAPVMRRHQNRQFRFPDRLIDPIAQRLRGHSHSLHPFHSAFPKSLVVPYRRRLRRRFFSGRTNLVD